MSDWDAARYHRLSDPQRSWGLAVLDRLAPAAGERILDVGCGTARLTSDLAARAASARVTGLDRSWSMLAEARQKAHRAVTLVHGDAVRLPFAPVFDAVFSTATFHWVPDHPRLFSEIHRVLRPRGRLVAQAGGGPNLSRLYERAAALGSEREFSSYFAGWTDPWTFAGIDDTRVRMMDAGFAEPKIWLEPASTPFPDAIGFSEFVSTVCLRHHLDRLPFHLRAPYVERLTDLAAADDPPLTLDYWRLNIDARK